MKLFTRLSRLIYIVHIILKYRLDQFISNPYLRCMLVILRVCDPLAWFYRPNHTAAKRLHKAIVVLGPVYIKFGQMLSTRQDLLSEALITELSCLQDKVPPFPGAQAKAIIEKEFGLPVEQLFHSFETKALASASIAQVHEATLLNGESVIVKLLRPGIKQQIHRDIALMKYLAGILGYFWHRAMSKRLLEVINEFERCAHGELDLLQEAASGAQLRRNFEGSSELMVPKMFWQYSRKHILVQERVYGIKISDVEELKKQGVDLQVLAKRGIDIFFQQVFRDNFFHADMHPGNIFVDTRDPLSPKYIVVDFGIMGSLSTRDQRYIADNLLAFFNRDYHRVAELHIESGWVSNDTRLEVFESAIRTVCEPIFDKPLKEISFAQLLLRLLQTAKQFNMTVQPQLILLQKTLLHMEALGRQLYPDLNVWVVLTPMIESWIKDKMGFKALIKGMRNNFPHLAEKLPELPALIYKSLKNFDDKLLQQHAITLLNQINHSEKNQHIKYSVNISRWQSMGVVLTVTALINLFVIHSQYISLATLSLFNWSAVALGGIMLLLTRLPSY